MKKRTAFILFISLLAISVILGACASNGEENAAGGDSEVEEATGDGAENGEAAENNGAEATGEVVELHLEASNFEFDQQEYVIPAGATVELTLSNTEGYHEAEIEGYNVEVKDNEPVTFEADEAGEFVIKCSIICGPVEDHDNMTATMIVE